MKIFRFKLSMCLAITPEGILKGSHAPFFTDLWSASAFEFLIIYIIIVVKTRSSLES